MKPPHLLAAPRRSPWRSRRGRAVWSDPVRKLRTLESFARTEADGGKDIAAAARAVTDPELRQHLLRHAADEERHAEMFHRRAAELRSSLAVAHVTGAESDKVYDLARGRPRSEVDAHGFFKVGLIDELGEVAYVAMLHVAERRAAALFEGFREDARDDAATAAVFEEILKDEKYHVAYTSRFLERWRRTGRGQEVESALSSAKGARLLGALKRAGLRAGADFGRTLLLVLFYTLLAPFGWLASRTKPPSGWVAPRPPAGRSGRAVPERAAQY